MLKSLEFLNRFDLREVVVVTHSPFMVSMIEKKIAESSLYIPVVLSHKRWFDNDKFFYKNYVNAFGELLMFVDVLKQECRFDYTTAFMHAKKIQKILDMSSEGFNNELSNEDYIYEYIDLIQVVLKRLGGYYSYRHHISDIFRRKNNTIIGLFLPEEYSVFTHDFDTMKNSSKHLRSRNLEEENLDFIKLYKCSSVYEEARCIIECIKNHSNKEISCIIKDYDLLQVIHSIALYEGIEIYQILKKFEDTRVYNIFCLSLKSDCFIDLLFLLGFKIDDVCKQFRKKGCLKVPIKDLLSAMPPKIYDICYSIYNDILEFKKLGFPIKFNELFILHLNLIQKWEGVFIGLEQVDIIPDIMRQVNLRIESVDEYLDVLKYISSINSVVIKNKDSKIYVNSPYESLAIEPDLLIIGACVEGVWGYKEEKDSVDEYTTEVFYKLLDVMRGKSLIITYTQSANKADVLYGIKEFNYKYSFALDCLEYSDSTVADKKIPKVISATGLNLFINDKYKFYLKYILGVTELSYGVNRYAKIAFVVRGFIGIFINYKKYNIGRKRHMNIDSCLLKEMYSIVDSLFDLYMCENIDLPRVRFFARRWLEFEYQAFSDSEYRGFEKLVYLYKGYKLYSTLDIVIDSNFFLKYKTCNLPSQKDIDGMKDWSLLIPYILYNGNIVVGYKDLKTEAQRCLMGLSVGLIEERLGKVLADIEDCFKGGVVF